MVIKVAIVGSGFGTYGLLPAFSRVEGCKVVSLCGKRSERLLSYCKKVGIDKIYADWKQMLQREKPDAVVIAVIPKYQHEIAKYALNNGIAVFAEKPLTTSAATASQLYKLAKRKNLPNMVDFEFPEIPEFVKTKELIKSDAIGKVLSISVNWELFSSDLKNKIKSWKTDANEGGGALSLFFSHVFYYLEYFLGEIKKLQCTLSMSKRSLNRGESIVNMILLFENGCIGNAHLNIANIGQPKHSIEFHGEDGTILLQNTSNNYVDNFELTISNQQGKRKIQPNYTYSISLDDGSEDSRVKPVTSIAKRFINWCDTGVPSKPDFNDGLRVQKLIETARASNSKFRK